MFPGSASSPTPPIRVVSPSDDDVPLLGRSPETVAQILSPQDMYSDLPGPPISPRPRTGRTNSWYTPLPRVRRGTLSGQPPLPADFQAHDPVHVPMPPGPPASQPPEHSELMAILREHRLAQLAAVDQQRELMRYMSSLSDWLGRDVQDRQAELRAIIARIDQLRDDLNRMSVGATPGWHLPGMHSTPFAGIPVPQPQAAGQGAGGYVVPPPGIGAPPPPVVPIGYPPGFVPQVGPQPMIPEIKSPRQPFSSPGSSRWDIPDLPPQYGDRTGPVRQAETPYKGYPLLGESALVMHALVFVISIILALGTFVRAEPVQSKGQDNFDIAIEPSNVYSHETPCDIEYREAAFCYFDGLDTASVNNVQESLSDVLRAFFTTPLNVTSDATWRGRQW